MKIALLRGLTFAEDAHEKKAGLSPPFLFPDEGARSRRP
jgi:hypothetical protein